MMGAPFEICSKRSVVAVLASGVVISLTALTGGIAPAFAKPDTDQVVTTTAPAPEPKVAGAGRGRGPSHEATTAEGAGNRCRWPRASSRHRRHSRRSNHRPTGHAGPTGNAATTAPVVTAVAPASPTTAVNPPVTKVETPAPRVVAPPSSEPSSVTSTATARARRPVSLRPSSPCQQRSRNQRRPGRCPRPRRWSRRARQTTCRRRAVLRRHRPSGAATPGSESKASEPKVSAAEGSSRCNTGRTDRLCLAGREGHREVGTADPAGAQRGCRSSPATRNPLR